jgi:phospholipid N-methyltransferase
MKATPTGVDVLVDRVLAERAVWPRLVAIEDHDEFAEALVALAAGWQLSVTAVDIRAAVDRRRREWFERWI